ncbi:MAG: hypothetical protein ACYSVY_18315 [Planctomycetota bacterium]|jgi:hypothetical protein
MADGVGLAEADPAADRRRQARDRKGILGLGAVGAVAASLCCLTPVVLVIGAMGLVALFGPGILGASSGSEVTQRIHRFTDHWYEDYKWAFRAFGIVAMALGLCVYFRRRGICSLDAARRNRNRVVNVSILTGIAGASIYLVWNYVVLHYWGKWAGLPW